MIDMAIGTAGDSIIDLEETEENPLSPSGLIGGSDHFDDMHRDLRRVFDRAAARATTGNLLPQQLLLNSVVNQGLKRPKPRAW